MVGDDTFKVDVDTLHDQGVLHQAIAQLLRDIANNVPANGHAIVNEFRNKNNPDDAEKYQLWLNPASFQQLEDDATWHDSWAQYFFDMEKQVRAAEDRLSGNTPRPAHGHWLAE